MRPIIILLLACGFAFGAQPPTNPVVYLAWNYSSNDLALADASGTPFNFIVYGAPNLQTNFVPLTNMEWTNFPVVGFDGTNYMLKTPYQMNAAGSYFFTASASNAFWGESIMSNTSSTPPIAVQLKLKLTPN